MDGLLAGVVLGLSIAAPIGPMGVLCIERALAGGFCCGLAAGLGAATVHAVYSGLAGLGLAQLGPLTGHWQSVQRFLTVALLLWLGCRILARSMGPATSAPAPTAILGCYMAAVILTLGNPVTVSLFAVLTPPIPLDGGAVQFPMGVFLGSALWWMVLSGSIHLARSRITDRAIRRFNGVCGLWIVGLALLFAIRPIH